MSSVLLSCIDWVVQPLQKACSKMQCKSLDRPQERLISLGSLTNNRSKYLREALTVTEKRKHILVAEHARVLFKLSEALEQESGGGDQAREKREEAEGLIRKRFPNAGDLTKESTYDDLIFIDWR